MSQPTEKVQKVLARQGIASRREIEKWILDKRITINGKLAKVGDRISSQDQVCINKQPVIFQNNKIERRLLIYHKPIGEICTRYDEKHRPTVFANLPKLSVGRWISIGRLDINSSGLLLFTNDGELANKLMHPSSNIEREYAVRVLGKVSDQALEDLTKGIMLEDGVAKFKSIGFSGGEGANQWYRVVVDEGRNRLVRRLWEAKNILVSRLIRVRFGTIILVSALSPGKFMEVEKGEINRLIKQLGL